MPKIITVGTGRFRGLTNQAIQAAVDAVAAAGGGTVEVPAGIYQMEDALHLRDNVEVIGEKDAVLRKIPSVSSPVADALGYGHHEFRPADPSLFHPGMGVCFSDRNTGGFYVTTATITGRKGDLFFMDQPLRGDCSPAAEGTVSSLFPIVSGCGIRKASVKKLVLDGNPNETRRLNGCRGGAIYLLQSHQVRIEEVEALNYYGDGISFQQCTDLRMVRCHLHHIRGNGLHPGSGSVRYVMRENRIHHNEGCGIFYCLRTTHSLCEENIIQENGGPGISIGERDTDHWIRDNTIRSNGAEGILFREFAARGGDRVRVELNTFEHNCRQRGEAEIVLFKNLHDILVADNEFQVEAKKMLAAGPGCESVFVIENTVGGRPQEAGDVSGSKEGVAFRAPRKFPGVGPAAVASDGALHLGIRSLSAWRKASLR